MRVMVIVKATPESEARALPDEKLLTEMGAYNEELCLAVSGPMQGLILVF